MSKIQIYCGAFLAFIAISALAISIATLVLTLNNDNRDHLVKTKYIDQIKTNQLQKIHGKHFMQRALIRKAMKNKHHEKALFFEPYGEADHLNKKPDFKMEDGHK